jgi:hypothetical protein
MFDICKKKRDDETARLVRAGRDVKADLIDVTFNAKTCQWEAVGSPEKEALNHEREAYENDPIVKTIKEILKRKPAGWSGTPTDLLMACVDITGYPLCESADSVGRKIKNLEVRLYADGIIHKTATNRHKGRQHAFYKKGYGFGGQASFIKDGNE